MSVLPTHLLPDHAVVDQSGRVVVAGCDLIDLAHRFGTPLFVYDEEHMRRRCRQVSTAFGEGAIYASKAFLCTTMARLAHEEGMRIDVATGGELHVALAAGVPAQDLVFHGNNKSLDELRQALTAGVGRIVVDSFDELDRLDQLHGEGFPTPRILLRITPGVEAHTHEYVATGHDDTKFGFTVSSGAASEAASRAAGSTSVELVGIHAHIGSQVFRVESFADAVAAIAAFANPLGLPEVIFGGGLGVAYVEGEAAPDLDSWARTIQRAAKEAGVTARIGVEPGRAIVADAAITLYAVGTIKDIPGVRTYVAVDGGMSDNPRPVLYGSGYETFLVRTADADRTEPIRLVGKHCESGDLLVRDGRLPPGVEVGDIVATPVTGAYGHSMGSNYNKVLRPAIVFVRDGSARLVVRRETYDDLLITDLGVTG